MQQVFKRAIADGVFLTVIPNTAFKTEHLSVNFLVPLQKKDVSANAVLPFLLARGEDMTALRRRLDALYGARLFTAVDKIGDFSLLRIGVETVQKRFADGEKSPLLRAAGLLCELITKPPVTGKSFRGADVEAEKLNVLGLLAAEQNDKQVFARNQCISFMMGNHPFGLCRYGDAASLTALTPRTLYRRWEKLLLSAQIDIVMVGEENADELAEVFSVFSKLQRCPVLYAPPKTLSRRRTPDEVTQQMDIVQTKLVLGYATDVALPQDTAAFTLFNALLGASPLSLLYSNVRERLSLCYYCNSHYDSVNGLVLIESGVEEKDAEAARAEIERQLAAVAAGEFSDRQLEEARLAVRNSCLELLSSPVYAGYYWTSESITGTGVSPRQKAEKFNAVTREQICAMAGRCRLEIIYKLAPVPASAEGEE